MFLFLRNVSLLAMVTGLLVACGGADETVVESTEPTRDNTEEVKAYYAANPDFFSFKTLADLPTDLTWENGMDLPEIGSDAAKKGGTQYGALSDFPRTLRRVGPDSNGSFRPYILDNVSVGIAHRHPDEFEHFPGLAESWAVDMENTTVYVKLNPKARWSDGVPVTSDDFMFMFFFFQSDYIVAPWYKNWYGSQYTNITKYDDLTFSISVPAAKPDMDTRVLGLGPVPQHFYKELGDDFVDRYQWRFQPTTGAYIIKDDDIKKGTSITLTRLDDWWAKDLKFFKNRFNADRIHLTVVRDPSKTFEMFKKGDLDQFGLNLAEYWYDKLPADDIDVANGYIQRSVFYNQRPRPTIGLWINTSKPMLDNQDVRIGLNHATNWELVIEKFFRGDVTRMETSSDGYGEFSHPDLKSRRYDIDKAIEHFAKAGFTERNEQGILVNDQGQKLAFTLTTGSQTLKDVMTILKEEALKAGVEFRIEVLDGTAGWKKVQEKQHDIQLTGFGVGLELYPRFWETYHSDNAYDDAFLDDGSVNPDRKVKTQTNNLEVLAIHEMDSMIDQYRESDDKQEMMDLAHAMTKMHHDYGSFVPGYYTPFYRVGHWRWVRYPEFFNHKHSSSSGQWFVHWLDEDLRKETLAAQKAGESFGPALRIYDQFK